MVVNIFKTLYRNALTSLRFFFRSARGVDHKILNHFIIKINQSRDIDSIIYNVSQCLYYILDCRFFAFAVYDSEYNGVVDIWIDPKTDSTPIVNFIKKDFFPQNTCCNIRYFNDTPGNRKQGLPDIRLTDILSYKVIDNQTRAMLHILPRRTMLNYHSKLISTVVEVLAASLANFINLKKLENAALIDPLTHCYNRRALNAYIDHDIANSERYGSDLSVFMFDIDHFKQTNDAHGHKAGDAVLRAVSKRVLSAIRKSDYLARYGGEEFILVMPETKFSKAIELAERVRKIIENLKISLGDKTINITASFGVMAYKKGTDKNTLFQKVDEMLYEAKRQGRNRIKPDLRLYQNTDKNPAKGEPLFY